MLAQRFGELHELTDARRLRHPDPAFQHQFAQRCQKAGIPESVTYQAKWQMALAMLRRAKNNGLGGVVLADSLFGTVTEFAEAAAKPP